ncbi:MAG: class I tRNA ligase family protein [Patescibacteria group bacterium]
MNEINFPKMEEEILRRWTKQGAFEVSLKLRKKSPRFVFYEGPPTANAGPGLHHMLSRVFKDVICRYKTMRGFLVERKAGWDTHGLPVELQIEKKLGLKSKKDIEKYGIAKFNKECKRSVWEFKKEWEDFTRRIGFWLDMEHPYITYEEDYIESLWGIIKQFWNKGLLYKDYKVVPYCPRCGTPLSSHEMAQGYKTVKEPSVYVKFRVIPSRISGAQGGHWKGVQTYLLAWTTTPWTLPGNVALAVGKDITYEYVKQGDEIYIVAQNLLKKVFGGDTGERNWRTMGEVQGEKLVGLEYEPLFDSLKNQPEKKHYVALGDFVSTQEGTGIVHTAVMYGEDDYQLGQRLGLPKRHTVDEEGKFNELVPQWQGMFVKDTDTLVIEDLKKRNLLLKEELYEHEYPFCWRCSTPLLYYAKESWFLNMQKVKKTLISNNRKINWIPSHMREGRMGEWLAEVKDWAFSRERYWGTPLPVWKCNTCANQEVIGSKEDLRKQRYSSNTYYLLRHGHSVRQITNVLSSLPEKTPFPLTSKGVREIQILAKHLKKKKIDLIFSSELLRTKQTAEIIGKELGLQPIYDKRIRELDVGIFNGKHVEEFGSFFRKEGETSAEHYRRRFSVRPPHGENWIDVQKRVADFMYELERTHQNKTILIVSHEITLLLLEMVAKGFSREEFVGYRKRKAIKTGEFRKLSLVRFPYNEDMELDFHRPYIDEVKFQCSRCKKGEMMRVKEVGDVWFDSGAMPFAQAHWPFKKNSKSDIRDQKLSQPELFPADYIVEAIDQTRGWFYTLLAVSTLLGFKSPYKNVISLGHLLDEKGEKMSKSKGNVVNPWNMIERYGVEAIRWYFFSINQPGDPKLFSERDIQQTTRKFILTLWNCFVFYETYRAGKAKIKNLKLPSSNILDRWILSRLSGTIREMTNKLDAYDITGAARTLESFVVDDVSLWYIRRSRQRFQNPSRPREKDEASFLLAHILLTTSKLAAPFIPFLSEFIYGRVADSVLKSVHWEDWPKEDFSIKNERLEEEMAKVREIVAKALAERAKAGIKVRQPLATLKIKNQKLKIAPEFHELIKEELNVKEIVFDKEISQEVVLDTSITPLLKKEGMAREIMRYIQEMRKEAGYKPRQRITLHYGGSEEILTVMREYGDIIRGVAGLKELREGEEIKEVFDRKQEFTLEGQKLWIGMRK